jgi:hypothetical protein
MATSDTTALQIPKPSILDFPGGDLLQAEDYIQDSRDILNYMSSHTPDEVVCDDALAGHHKMLLHVMGLLREAQGLMEASRKKTPNP